MGDAQEADSLEPLKQRYYRHSAQNGAIEQSMSNLANQRVMVQQMSTRPMPSPRSRAASVTGVAGAQQDQALLRRQQYAQQRSRSI